MIVPLVVVVVVHAKALVLTILAPVAIVVTIQGVLVIEIVIVVIAFIAVIVEMPGRPDSNRDRHNRSSRSCVCPSGVSRNSHPMQMVEMSVIVAVAIVTV